MFLDVLVPIFTTYEEPCIKFPTKIEYLFNSLIHF